MLTASDTAAAFNVHICAMLLTLSDMHIHYRLRTNTLHKKIKIIKVSCDQT